MTFGGRAEHMVENALGAAAACLGLGVDPTLVATQQVWTQYWSRDSGSPSGGSLTNGITFTICP